MIVLTAIQDHDQALVQHLFENDGKHFRFLDLSAELRNKIYNYSLVLKGKIQIQRRVQYGWDDFGPGYIWCYVRKSLKPKLRFVPLRCGLMGWARVYVFKSLSPNLLVTCKAIHQEGTPMLYGSNAFVLDDGGHTDKDPETWTSIIGNSIEHLRTVTIKSARTQNYLKSILSDLKGARHLEKLVINRFCSANFRTPSTMLTGLYPLVLHMHKSRKNTDKKPVLSVLEIQGKDGKAAKEALKKRLKL